MNSWPQKSSCLSGTSLWTSGTSGTTPWTTPWTTIRAAKIAGIRRFDMVWWDLVDIFSEFIPNSTELVNPRIICTTRSTREKCLESWISMWHSELQRSCPRRFTNLVLSLQCWVAVSNMFYFQPYSAEPTVAWPCMAGLVSLSFGRLKFRAWWIAAWVSWLWGFSTPQPVSLEHKPSMTFGSHFSW